MQKKELQQLLKRLEGILAKAQALEQQHAEAIARVHPAFSQSARNLLHYLALRNADIRTLQEQLSLLGLSSLGRSESHVLPSLQAVRHQLQQLLDCVEKNPILELTEASTHLKELLTAHTRALLGPLQEEQSGSVMVTMDADMAQNGAMLQELLRAGMNCARINCAHDGPETWRSLIATIRKAASESGIECRIFMDLAGPKLRTGPLIEQPKLLQLKPKMDIQGKLPDVINVWLAPPGTEPPRKADAQLPISPAWLQALEKGQTIRFKDVRGRKRSMLVQEVHGDCVLAHLNKNAYISSGIKLSISSDGAKESKSTRVGVLPAEEVVLRLYRDDLLLLHARHAPGEPSKLDEAGNVLEPAHISCSLPGVLADVRTGERVLLNDGKIEGVVTEASADLLKIRITFAKAEGSRLKGNKSINFPDSNLHLHGLTDKDREDLAFVVQHADVVNVSFVQTPADIEELFAELKRLQAPPLGVLLKIETQRAFQNLPLLLLTLMQHYPAGIMIARGDLAVEVGWNRLAEVQEEILWLCEAAHLPVVWATQVLETLAKKGRPSRAEITDAAMSQRAECVMLNKGPYILETIRTLRDIMNRMQGHQSKKTSMLRSLTLADFQ
jgi:pyruvate kinase